MATYKFDDYKKDALERPRDKAWSNWSKFENVGDKVQGYIRDAFFRAEDGVYKEQRGITLETVDGTLINVAIKRLPFILPKTDNLRMGDPLTVVLEEEKPSATKGYNATKIFSYYGKELPENAKNKTVKEMEDEDIKAGGTVGVETTEPQEDEETIDF